jgi:CRP/FNR family transcriptional regulator
MKALFKDQEKITRGSGAIITDPSCVYYIVDGFVGLFMREKKKRKLLFVLKEGDIFPFPHFLKSGQKKLPIGFEALQEVTLQALPVAEFNERVLSSRRHTELLFEQFQELHALLLQRVSELNEKSVLVRLIYRLRYLAARFGHVEGNEIRIAVPFTHTALALSLGSTRETVNRLMRQLEKQGLIWYQTGIVTIPSLQKLEALLPEE